MTLVNSTAWKTRVNKYRLEIGPQQGVNLQDLMNALISRGIRVNVVAQTDNVYGALALVAAGIGVAVVPGHFEVASVKTVPVKDLNIERTIGLLWPRERKNGPLKEFYSICRRPLRDGLRHFGRAKVLSL